MDSSSWHRYLSFDEHRAVLVLDAPHAALSERRKQLRWCHRSVVTYCLQQFPVQHFRVVTSAGVQVESDEIR